jgi:error-prone DNA polymerase
MGFNNPDIPWSDLEGRLSGRVTEEPPAPAVVDPLAIDADGPRGAA